MAASAGLLALLDQMMMAPHDDSAAVGHGEFVITGRDAAPLLDVLEEPFLDVAAFTNLSIKGRRSAASAAASLPVRDLVRRLRNDRLNASGAEKLTVRLGGIHLIAHRVRCASPSPIPTKTAS